MFFLFHRGLHLSVEFTGGTVMEVAYQQSADVGKVRETIGKLGYADVQVQNFGTSRDVQIRLPAQKGMNATQQSDAGDGRAQGGRPVAPRCAATSSSARRSARSSPPTA